MQFDVRSLRQSMTDAVRNAVGPKRWLKIKPIAEEYMKTLAAALESTRRMRANDEIDDRRAFVLVEIQRKAARQALQTIQGIGVQTANEAIDAATTAVRAVVNRLIGFKLI